MNPKPISEIMQGVDLELKSRVKEIMSVGDGIPQHNEVERENKKGQAAQCAVVPAVPFTDEDATLFAKPIELSVARPAVWRSLSDVTTYVAIAYRIGIACTTEQDVMEVCGDRGSEIYVPGEGEGEVTELFKNKELSREESFARTILLVPNSNVGMFPLSMAMYRELKAEAQRNALTRASTAIREMDKQLQHAAI